MTRRRRKRPHAIEVGVRSQLGLAPVEQLELLQASAPAGAGEPTNDDQNQSREGATQPTRRSS